MDRNYTEFVGFLVTGVVDDCLRLQSLIRDIPKGTLVREIVTDHIEENKWSLEGLMDKYADYLFHQWEFKHKERKTFPEYLATQVEFIKSKHKLPEHLIEGIIERCVELHQNSMKK